MQILLWSTSSLAPLRQLFPGSIFLDVQLALADTCLLALSPLAPQRKVTRHPSHHTHTSTMSYCSHKRRCFCFLSLLSSALYPTASFRPLLQTHKWLWLLRSTSHVTRHTSHLTPHTSHLTPHTSVIANPQRRRTSSLSMLSPTHLLPPPARQQAAT